MEKFRDVPVERVSLFLLTKLVLWAVLTSRNGLQLVYQEVAVPVDKIAIKEVEVPVEKIVEKFRDVPVERLVYQEVAVPVDKIVKQEVEVSSELLPRECEWFGLMSFV